jgi:hypothetical protein
MYQAFRRKTRRFPLLKTQEITYWEYNKDNGIGGHVTSNVRKWPISLVESYVGYQGVDIKAILKRILEKRLLRRPT